MPRSEPKCPKCSVEMEKGVIIDRGHGNQHLPAQWLEGGDEQKGSFLGVHWTSLKTAGRTIRKIDSYRCPNCGVLQNYAD